MKGLRATNVTAIYQPIVQRMWELRRLEGLHSLKQGYIYLFLTSVLNRHEESHIPLGVKFHTAV
jgi:hypothetical protein